MTVLAYHCPDCQGSFEVHFYPATPARFQGPCAGPAEPASFEPLVCPGCETPVDTERLSELLARIREDLEEAKAEYWEQRHREQREQLDQKDPL